MNRIAVSAIVGVLAGGLLAGAYVAAPYAGVHLSPTLLLVVAAATAFGSAVSVMLLSFGKAAAYPSLEPLIAGRINVALIRAHWSEILRVAASIRTGTVTASLILRQLASYPRQNGLATALRELGRLERTLFTLDWLEDRELRRQTSQELNKGESRNSLARAVFIHRLGEIRDRHLREPATPRFRPEPAGHRNHPVEHAVPRSRRRRSAPDRGCPGPTPRTSLPARLGARKPHRGLHLERRATGHGKP